MPFPRQSNVGYSLWRSGFEPGSVLMGFMDVNRINIVSSSCKMSDDLSGFNQCGHPRQIITNVPNIKFHSTPSSKSPVCVPRDRPGEAKLL